MQHIQIVRTFSSSRRALFHHLACIARFAPRPDGHLTAPVLLRPALPRFCSGDVCIRSDESPPEVKSSEAALPSGTRSRSGEPDAGTSISHEAEIAGNNVRTIEKHYYKNTTQEKLSQQMNEPEATNNTTAHQRERMNDKFRQRLLLTDSYSSERENYFCSASNQITHRFSNRTMRRG